jgi:hypothetical protein
VERKTGSVTIKANVKNTSARLKKMYSVLPSVSPRLRQRISSSGPGILSRSIRRCSASLYPGIVALLDSEGERGRRTLRLANSENGSAYPPWWRQTALGSESTRYITRRCDVKRDLNSHGLCAFLVRVSQVTKDGEREEARRQKIFTVNTIRVETPVRIPHPPWCVLLLVVCLLACLLLPLLRRFFFAVCT